MKEIFDRVAKQELHLAAEEASVPDRSQPDPDVLFGFPYEGQFSLSVS